MTSRRKPLRILWTLPYLPWPTSTGGRTRQYALLRQMAERGHRITLLCLAKDTPDYEGLSHLSQSLEELIVVPRRSRTSTATLLSTALAFRRPAVATVNGRNHRFSKAFKCLLETAPDLVQVEHTYAFEPLSSALTNSKVPFFITEHNVESRLVEQQYVRLPPCLRPLAKVDAWRYRCWERKVMRKAACVIAVSPQDEAEFRLLGAQATAVVPNCIDTASLAHVVPDSVSQQVLFLGNYEYAPNVDAVHWLCNSIIPRLWQLQPRARLVVGGNAMPTRWRQLWTDPRIQFRGYVPDLAQAHANSSVFVAPLRAGGGSKLKVLEAMASSLPVVGTLESVSGLRVQPGVHYLAGEHEDLIATSLSFALSNSDRARQIGSKARQYVVSNHDWKAGADALEEVYYRRISSVPSLGPIESTQPSRR